MQYTIRGIPESLDRALRALAARERRSLNEVAVETMMRALGLEGEAPKVRDLSDIAGSWIKDSRVERALEDQRAIDPDLWS